MSATERGIGNIGNYYGGLSVKKDGDKFLWSIEDYGGEDWQEIPHWLYDALVAFEEGRSMTSPAPASDGLVERLRAGAVNAMDTVAIGTEDQRFVHTASSTLMEQAADALSAKDAELSDLRRQVETLTAERDEARETNRRLNRRIQRFEKGVVSRALRRKAASVEWWRKNWGQTFRRMCSAHGELKEVFEACAPVLGLPHGRYHSVMDSRFGVREPNGAVWANVYLTQQGGIESFHVVDAAKQVAARAEAAESRLATILEECAGKAERCGAGAAGSFIAASIRALRSTGEDSGTLSDKEGERDG